MALSCLCECALWETSATCPQEVVLGSLGRNILCVARPLQVSACLFPPDGEPRKPSLPVGGSRSGGAYGFPALPLSSQVGQPIL